MAGRGSATLALKITGDASDANRALGATEDRANRFGKAMKTAGAVAGVALVGLGYGLKSVYEAADESRKITALTEQVIKSTGGAAKVTAKEVGDLAGAIAKKTGVDDEAIQSGANLLLTFTNVQNKAGKGNAIFDRATQIMTDMSVALGTDASASAIQLGKALNDPIKGVTALQKVGVSFTESQKKQIKTLVESGDTLGAQKIILEELGKEFGGAAEAAATPLGKLKQRLGDISEQIGGYLIPAVDSAATFLGDRLAPAVSDLWDQIGPKLGAAFQSASDYITITLLPALSSLWNEIEPKLTPALKDLGSVLTDTVQPAFRTSSDFILNTVVPLWRDAMGHALDGTKQGLDDVRDALDRNKDKWRELQTEAQPVVDFIKNVLAPVFGVILKLQIKGVYDQIALVIDALGKVLDLSKKVGGISKYLPGLGGIGALGGLFGAAGPSPAGATGGGAPGLFGAARGTGMFGAASSSPGGGGASPSAAAGGLSLAGPTTVINLTVNGALDPVAVGRQIEGLLRDYGRSTGRRASVAMGAA